MAFCEQCGNKISDTAKFCGKCGAPVVSGQTEVPEASGQGGMSACQQCGAPLDEDEVFCSNCGARVGVGQQFMNKDVSEDFPSSFSMEIDDIFFISGRGTVVTGTISAGSIKLNEEVTIIGGNQEIKTKVTGIEMFNKVLNEAKTGDNVGLLLQGVEKNDVNRGYIITAKVSAVQGYQPVLVQTQGQAGGGEVLKERKFSLVSSGNLLLGNLLLYRDRLEWKGDTYILIPIAKISSAKLEDYYNLKIKLDSKEKYSFSADIPEMGDVPINKLKLEAISWVDAINSVRKGTLG